jgi:hypothetical protein
MGKCEYIDGYIAAVRSGEIPASKELRRACDYIGRRLSAPGVFVDAEKTEKAKELIERYFGMRLFD